MAWILTQLENPKFEEMAQPGLVSIIVPCYNVERFLVETLESALVQSYRFIEIIIIDDGSTDGTAKIIHSYGDRVRGDFGPNRGASAARNRGTALARGEFIQYLDADDLLLPGVIERRVDALQATDADVAYSDWEKLVEVTEGVFEVGERVTTRIEDLDPSPKIAQLRFWAPPAALTYRRAIVQQIGGWKEWLPIIQDARFLQDAGLVGGRFVYAPGVGARYRVHRGPSLSRRGEAAFVSDVFRNGCDLQAVLEARGEMHGEMRRVFEAMYDYTARSLFFHDRAAFCDCMSRLEEFQSGFRLTWPKVASLVSRMLGFKVAEAILRSLTKLRRAFPYPAQLTKRVSEKHLSANSIRPKWLV
jgi:glycosyltransferase involved in cell wall biosynthesis